MALTLLEAAKRSQDPVQSAVIEMYAGASDVLANLGFDNIQGSAMKYNREETLPGIGFRGINESYTESTGVINPQIEPLVIGQVYPRNHGNESAFRTGRNESQVPGHGMDQGVYKRRF